MKNRVIYTARAWIHYINNCSPLAYGALLLVVLFTVFTCARFFYNAGAADAMRNCRVYSEGRVRIVYAGRVYDHNYPTGGR